MSREIKFRAWDIKGKEMIYGDSFCDLLNIFGKEGGDDGSYILRAWDSSIYRHVWLMQYTGLKDKNGKEIYEGDIVKTERGKIKVIEWYDYMWGAIDLYYHKNKEGDPYSCEELLPFIRESEEIIGNIYENKELLDENNNIK
jgi:uncharacterized phage protein (TIGR01671 family)